jgi:hypothetical protein
MLQPDVFPFDVSELFESLQQCPKIWLLLFGAAAVPSTPTVGILSTCCLRAVSGHKAWQMRFRRPDGRPGKITLGPFERSGRELTGDPQIGQPLTLQAARQLAATVHRDRALGHDVVADHRARRHRQRTEIEERAANTFGAAVRAYIAEYARPKTRNWLETARLLGLRYVDGEPEEAKGGLAQRWADRPVAGIDAHDIWSVIDEARRVAIPGNGQSQS